MSELKLQKVYIEVDAKDELPNDSGTGKSKDVITFNENGKLNEQPYFYAPKGTDYNCWYSENPKTWLKEQEGYFFSESEYAAQQSYIKQLENALKEISKQPYNKDDSLLMEAWIETAKETATEALQSKLK